MKENKENLSFLVILVNLDYIKLCWYWDKKDLVYIFS